MNFKSPVAFIVAVKRESTPILDQLTILETIEENSICIHECRYLESPVIVAVCGIGIDRTYDGLTLVLKRYQPSLIFSIGFAGAVVPKLKKGDVIIGKRIISLSDKKKEHCSDSSLVKRVNNALDTARIEYTNGCVMTVPKPIFNRKEKNRLSKEYGCHAIEMETAAIAEISLESSTPFISIRFVLDELREDLSKYFQLFSKNSKRSIAHYVSLMVSLPGIIKSHVILKKCLESSQHSISDVVKPILNEICEAKK